MITTAFKIKKLRENKSYTQEYMALQLNISQPAYAQIESGQTAITIQKLKKIAEVLEIDIAKLTSPEDFVLDIHHNTLNDNASIIKELNHKQNELYERLINEKDKIIKTLEDVIELLKAK